MEKNVTISENVAAVLNKKSYEEWKRLSYSSVINVLNIWHTLGEGKLVNQEVMDILVHFKYIIDAYFNRHE